MNKIDTKRVFIKNTEISDLSKVVLIALGVRSVDDLHLMYLLDTIPEIGTDINAFPLVNASMIYTKEVNEDVNLLLNMYCNVEEDEYVGVR